MRNLFLESLSCCVLISIAFMTGTGQSETIFDVAQPCLEIPGAPPASAVCMRSLRPRPMNENDPYDTLEAIRRFHVTWLEWTYVDDPAFIEKVHAMGVTFGAAASAGSYMGDAPRETWNVHDREGTPVYATWMRAWKQPNPWGCANHPEFRAGHLRFVQHIIDIGADLIQRDEPRQNQHALRWGGCFCEHCMKAFNTWLEKNGDPDVLKKLGIAELKSFDYREYLRERNAPIGDDFGKWKGDELKQYFEQFQIDSTESFDQWWREELNKYAGRYVPVSCNNGVQSWNKIEEAFDYCIGELSAAHATPEYLYNAMKTAASHGKTQSVTMPLQKYSDLTPEWLLLIRQTIAAVYAVGSHIEMPWDTYLPTPDAQRFFGDPADYADLTGFVLAMAPYLDGYDDTATCGGEIKDERWTEATAPVVIDSKENKVYAFTRVQPGKSESAAVVHLINWNSAPEPFKVTLNPSAFYGNKQLRCRLFTPIPYEKQAHEQAFENKDYSALIREIEVSCDKTNMLEIPALTPWGHSDCGTYYIKNLSSIIPNTEIVISLKILFFQQH